MLEKYLEGYDKELARYIVNGFSKGFSLEFKGERSYKEPRNLRSAENNIKITRGKLRKRE